MIEGTSAKQVNISENSKNVSSSIPAMEWKRYNRPVGWKKVPVGQYKSGSNIKQISDYELYVRQTSFDDFLKKSSKSQIQTRPQNPVNTGLLGMGSSYPMGNPDANLTPSKLVSPDTAVAVSGTSERNSSNLPELAQFHKYPSLVKIRAEKPCILIGFDSKWQNVAIARIKIKKIILSMASKGVSIFLSNSG